MKIKKYLTKQSNGGYPVYKINKCGLHIASRRKYEDIQEIYEDCENVGWDMKKLKEIKSKWMDIKEKRRMNNPMRYILVNTDKFYEVMRKGVYYCYSRDKEEIMYYRDLLEKNNWDKDCLPIKRQRRKLGLPKYIQKTKKGSFTIKRKNETWGTFSTLQDAIEERDLLIQHNWDYGNFVDLY